ncbi:LPS export ABC transporter periplasmic protein LptC [Thiomonas intermedia]|uniref:LPS export ABC transporter periplasmic protein LptC n=1 Tax=Thiomonas intermedia TaxID=926 RepID=UPI0009A4EAB7|nr:LPS export ABC transporter periplasmic protein LptC [Thiomonas intermedia]
MRTNLRQLWLRLSAWTPILLLALAAGFSWWVAQVVTRSEQGPRRGAAHSALPDYMLREFSATSYNAQGQLGAVLRGTQMVHRPDTDTFDITAPQLRAVNPEGIVTTASALRGLSNKDGSNVQLFGHAVVQRSGVANQPPLIVRGEFLNIFPHQQIIQSNRPTVVQQGQTVFSANTVDFNGIAGTSSMQGRVKAVIVPGQATQEAKP